MRKLVLWVVLGVTLFVANLKIVGKERVLREGRTVLLQLAPRDPRSLLQGDFMALRYVLANEVSRQRSGEVSSDGRIVVTLDANDIATFVRFDDGSDVVGSELLLHYRKRGEGVRIASEAFFFEEGQGPRYQSALYGELRVDAAGDAVLVGLRDEDLRELRPGPPVVLQLSERTAPSPELRLTMEGRSFVRSVAFSPDGMVLASSSDEGLGTVRLWRVGDGALLRTLDGHTHIVTSLAFSPDGTTLASGSWDGTIRLWRVTDGEQLLTLTGHTDYVESIAISPNGITLASGSGNRDRTIRLWRMSDGVLLHTLEGRLGDGIISDVESVAFFPDGETLVSGAPANVQLWRVADGELLRQLDSDFEHTDGGSKLALSPDGAILALSSDYSVRLYRVTDGVLLGTVTGHNGRVRSVAFSPDGATLASASDDGTVRLWTVADAALRRTLTGHRGTVYSVAFSADGTTVASGGRDGTIRLWSVQQ